MNNEYDIQNLVDSCKKHPHNTINNNTPFATVKVSVGNVGNENSNYVGLLFLSSKNAGPAARLNKSLVSYLRLNNITTQSEQVLHLPLTLSS